MLKSLDNNWWQGDFLLFRDDGNIGKGKVTHSYAVLTSLDKTQLGTVRWYVPWRQYCFFPFNIVLEKQCLRDLADFCEDRTVFQRKLAYEKSLKKPRKPIRHKPKGSSLPNYMRKAQRKVDVKTVQIGSYADYANIGPIKLEKDLPAEEIIKRFHNMMATAVNGE